MGKIVGVVSLKGGVGKTSSVVSLGQALADFGKKVCLVDANFSAPNLGLHLNVINPEKSLQHVLTRKVHMHDVIHDVGGMHVVPSSLYGRHKINPFKLKDYVKPLSEDYDVTLLDSSPALNEETLAAMLASDELFAVTTPDYATLGTTLKALKIAKQRGTPVSGLILNKVHGKNFELGLDEIEEASETPVVAVVPYDKDILRAQSKFISSVKHNPKTEASKEYKKLAAAISGEKFKPFSFNELLRLSPKKQDINREIMYKPVFDKAV